VRAALRLSVLVSLLLGAISCSGSRSVQSDCRPAGATASVQMKDFAFEPTCIGAPAGGTLALENTGSTPHSFTVQGTSVTQIVNGGAGAQASLTGVAPGTYAVVCTFHPQMVATLVVTAV
jgi:plastocyanin